MKSFQVTEIMCNTICWQLDANQLKQAVGSLLQGASDEIIQIVKAQGNRQIRKLRRM